MFTKFSAATVLCFMLSSLPTLADAPFVRLETVTASDAEVRRVFFGRVVARETVDLAFQAGGQIVDFPVEEGAFVPADDVVASLDQVPFELALEEAQVQYEQALRTVTRLRALLGSAVSETAVQDAETDLNLAELAVRNAERALSQATLHSPFDALVAARLVPNFSTVGSGTAVLRMHDMSDLRVEIDVPETLFQRAGQDPDVSFSVQFPSGEESFEFDIREVNAETASIGQTYTITLGREPLENLTIWPGSSATVVAVLGTSDGRIEIPASAVVVENDGSNSVVVFTPTGASAGTVARTAVEIIPTDSGRVQVVEGLEPGQEIVTIAGGQLDDGTEVRRFVGFEE